MEENIYSKHDSELIGNLNVNKMIPTSPHNIIKFPMKYRSLCKK